MGGGSLSSYPFMGKSEAYTGGKEGGDPLPPAPPLNWDPVFAELGCGNGVGVRNWSAEKI